MKCKGCGVKLQCDNKENIGYTPSLDNKLCERCFKLKNYNVLTNIGINIDNKKILTKINKMKYFVIFLCDYLSICQEVMDTYKEIKSKKMLVITKSDLIPKNVTKDKFIKKIKDRYGVWGNVILFSSKNKENIRTIEDIIRDKKEVIVSGYSNAGKSSMINALMGSDITVSRSINTTQDFISMNFNGLKIIDAPGFLASICKLDVRSIIKPRTYQLQNKYFLQIGKVIVDFLNDTNVTIYVSNEEKVNKYRKKEILNQELLVPKGSDIVLKGIGVIMVSNDSKVYLSTSDYEIRPSLYGGNL